MISRRDALKLGAAGIAVPPMMSLHQSAIASQSDPSVWNWAGNAGHTGERPGPPLDIKSAVGEKWRREGSSDTVISGIHNDIVYFSRVTGDGYRAWRIEAVNCSDGTLLWSVNAPGYTNTHSSDQLSTPGTATDGITFGSNIAIIQAVVLCSLSNGQLWALDAMSGDLQWEYTSGYDKQTAPTVSNGVAYMARSNGILALELENPPKVRWDVDMDGDSPFPFLLGVDADLAWIGGSTYLSALEINSGQEFWRVSSENFWEYLPMSLGIGKDVGVFERDDSDQLLALNGQGSEQWVVDDSEFNKKWIIGSLVVRTTPTSSNWTTCTIESISIEDATLRWRFDLNTDRWEYSAGYDICDGIGYALFWDNLQGEQVLLVIDTTAMTVHGLRNRSLYPELVSGGYMMAIDWDAEEFVCIGPVSGNLQSGGQARVTEDTTVFGAPNPSSVIRGQVSEGTQLTVSGDAEMTSNGDWYPVTIDESGTSGWLPVEYLEGLAGDIIFEPIDIGEFGVMTTN